MTDIPQAIRPIQEHVSRSIQQSRLDLDRQWNGLCVACCLALKWQLSMENLGAVKASLLSMYAQQSQGALSGGASEPRRVEWSTFAQKVLADSKRDSERMVAGTRWSWLNFRQSSLTRRIYSTRRTLLRSRKRSLTGAQ